MQPLSYACSDRGSAVACIGIWRGQTRGFVLSKVCIGLLSLNRRRSGDMVALDTNIIGTYAACSEGVR